MKRVVNNFKFLKKVSFTSQNKLAKVIASSNKEQVKAIVECILNSPSTPPESISSLAQSNSLREIKGLLKLNARLVKNSSAFIVAEILSCVLASFNYNAEDIQSNTS